MKFALLGCVITVLAFSAQTPKFKDIGGKPGSTQSAIRKMASEGVMPGRSAQQFAPDAPITRAEFAAAMQKMFDLPQPVRPEGFPDVPPSSPNYSAVQAVTPHLCRAMLCFRCALGKNFLPNEMVSRAEMTMILTHILVSENKLQLLSESETLATLAGVTDAAKIPPPARPFFATAIKHKIVDLEPGKAIALALTPTRADMAVYMANVQKKFSR